jgi:hypothetical protein
VEVNAVEMGRAVSSLTTDLLLGDDNPDEPFLVRMKPNFDTACWSFLPPHRIYIGDKCLSRAKKGLRKAGRLAYLKAFFRHEVSHLRWTERDLKMANLHLAKVGIPFSLWNLFEDARIEHKERERSGEPFGWALHETPALPALGEHAAPVNEFFLLIQLENEGRGDRMPEIVEFYDRAINASTSMDLIPILEDWIRRFGKDAPPERFSGELQTSLNLQLDGKQLAEFDEGTFKPGALPPTTPEPVKLTAKKRSKLLNSECEAVDFLRAERLAKKFLALFGSRTVTTRSEEPSARISARHLELERPCYKRKTTIQSVAKRLCLVIDCSGSMSDGPIEDARLLAWSLSYLASLGKIKGCLILSAVKGDTAVNEVFEFPVAKDVVERIHAFGDAEGLNAAILSNYKKLADADMVFVKTDGCICDEPLDRREVQSKGITVCGLYSGGVENADEMKKHFKRFFVRDSLESLIDALLQSRLA